MFSGIVLGLFATQALAESDPARACALRLKDARISELQAAYRSAQDFSSFASLPAGRGFDELFDTPDALFAAIQTGQCQAVVVDGATAALLEAAMAREGLGRDVMDIKTPDQVIDGLWARSGFASKTGFLFSRSVSPMLSAGEVRDLSGFGVSDAVGYRAALDRMTASGYPGQRNTAWLLDFLENERKGRATGRTALAVREEQQARVRSEAAAARRAELAEFPYVAYVSCGMGGNHISTPACFMDTDLEVRNGSVSSLYKMYELDRAGDETGMGLRIRLRSSFTLRARNSDDTLVLGVTVKNASTGQVLFQQQAGQFRTILVSR